MGRSKEDPGYVGLKYMKLTPRKNRIIVLEDLDFIWDEPELNKLAQMWNEYSTIEDIAKHFDRDIDEILLALLHLDRNEMIEKRKAVRLMDLRKANLSQLQFIARFTKHRKVALKELMRREKDARCCDSQKKQN